jgi:hypothetical protein
MSMRSLAQAPSRELRAATSSNPQSSHPQLQLVAGIAFVWALTVASALSRWSQRQLGPAPVGSMFLGALPTWVLWALAGIALIPIVRLVQRRCGDPAVLVCVHVLLGGATIYAYCVLLHITQLGLHVTDLQMPWWYAAWAIARYRMLENSLIYLGIVGFVVSSDLAAKFRAQALAAQRLSTELASARLEALRLKLNPHFLFNALNGTTMLIRSGENARAVEAVVGLSALLRQLLEEREPLVPLETELSFIESYVDVERVRLGDRLTMAIHATREARDARVPFLTLQPLVENSIRHGIAPRGVGGRVTIEARRDGEWLDVHVVNDGAASPAAARGFGLGLATTRQRLEQLFGDGYELTLDVREHSRTTAVRVRVPFFTAAFEQHE